MYDGENFICDFCNKPIKTKEVVEVHSIKKDSGGSIITGDVTKYFHLRGDSDSMYCSQRGGRGCYLMWVNGDDVIVPHQVVSALKKDILESLR